MKKILILTDFSGASKKAAHFAQALFSTVEVEFHLLHTYPVDPDAMYISNFLLGEAERNAEHQLQTMLKEMSVQPIPSFHTYHPIAIPGNPIAVMEEMQERESYDYIVVGAGGQGVLPILGSTATGIIRQAKTNVLVIPHNTFILPLKKVVLAMDYNTVNNINCLQPLNALITLKNAELTVLSVVNNRTPILKEVESEELGRLVSQAFDSAVMYPYFIIDQQVEHGIETYLETHKVDLLVTIPHRKSLMDALWNRSLTRRLAYNPRVPLLTLYDPELSNVSKRTDDTGDALINKDSAWIE